jgi:cell shape-determining protein MreD
MAWRGIKLAAAVFLAGILQAALADAVNPWGGRPDLLLTTALVGAMFCGEGASALLGFSAALIYASLAAPPHAGVGSILVSRTLVCFGIGCMEDRLYRDSVMVALIVVLLGTLSAECLFFVFYPQHNVLAWARMLLLTLAWNGALAVPCFYAMRALLGAHRTGEKG